MGWDSFVIKEFKIIRWWLRKKNVLINIYVFVEVYFVEMVRVEFVFRESFWEFFICLVFS